MISKSKSAQEMFGGVYDAAEMDKTFITAAGVYGVRINQDCLADNPAEDFGVYAPDVSEYGAHSRWTGGNALGGDYIGHALTALAGGIARGYCGEAHNWRISTAAFVRYLRLAGIAAALVDTRGELLVPTSAGTDYGWNFGYTRGYGLAGVLVDRESKHRTAEESACAFEGYVEAQKAYEAGEIWMYDVIDPAGETVETVQGVYGAFFREEATDYAETVAHIDAVARCRAEAEEDADEASHAAEAAAHAALYAEAVLIALDPPLEALIAQLAAELEAAMKRREKKVSGALLNLKTA